MSADQSEWPAADSAANNAAHEQESSHRRLYIDNPWEDVEAVIAENAADHIANYFVGERQNVERLGKLIAASIMDGLEGSEAEADPTGLRADAQNRAEFFQASQRRYHRALGRIAEFVNEMDSEVAADIRRLCEEGFRVD